MGTMPTNTKARLEKPGGSMDESSVGETFIKRGMDIGVSVIALTLLWPVLIFIAVSVKLTSPGPVIFRQKRQGRNGYTFDIYKFRTMKIHEDQEGVTQAKKNDDRVTQVGSILRRTSLDELPQLFNVLKGDMSIVGPRPHAVEHNQYYSQMIPNYMCRHHVAPGLTGWAQINGCRGETETIEKMEKRVEYDLWYIKNWSPLLDVKIILKTPLVLIFNEAY
jgi:exopolysaccharide biosynthesis polyprenyl glycosylphosphotransferase